MSIKHITSKFHNKIEDTIDKDKDVVENIVDEVKERINNLYEGSKQKIYEVEDKIQDYSDELVVMVKNRPINTLLIIGGVSLILLGLFKKFE